MSDSLDKAKAALADAAAMNVTLELDRVPRAYVRRLDIATVQSQVAQAEALERIARALETRPLRVGSGW